MQKVLLYEVGVDLLKDYKEIDTDNCFEFADLPYGGIWGWTGPTSSSVH